MGYVLFWLEAAITTVLFLTLTGAWIARRHRRILRVTLWTVTTLVVLIPWAAVIAGFSIVYDASKLGLFQLWISSVCLGVVILACVVVARAGRRRTPAANQAAQTLPAHRSWRLNRLALAFAAALLVTAMTYWNLSLAVQQEMAAAHAEAAARLQSVWPAPVPVSMNAEPIYRQAFEILDVQITPKSKLGNVLDDLHSEYFSSNATRPATQPIGPVLAKFGPVLTLARQGAAMPEYNADIEFKGMATLLPPLSRYRALSKLLVLDALQAARDGRSDQAMEDITSSFNMAGHIAQAPTLICAMTSVSMDTLTVQALQRVLAIAPPTAESLGHLRVSASSGAFACLRSGFRLEYANTIMTLSSPEEIRYFGQWQWHAAGMQFDLAPLLGPTGPYRTFLWPEDVATARHYFQTILSMTGMPFDEWKQKAGPFQRGGPEMPGLVGSQFIPELVRFRDVITRSEARHRQAYLAKAMWLYRLKNGHFPEKLELLAPGFVPVVPKDPFTDKDMLIGRTAGGKTFIYSIGSDLKDDGGLLEPGQDKKDRDHGDIVFYLEGGRPLPASQPAPASAPAATSGGG